MGRFGKCQRFVFHPRNPVRLERVHCRRKRSIDESITVVVQGVQCRGKRFGFRDESSGQNRFHSSAREGIACKIANHPYRVGKLVLPVTDHSCSGRASMSILGGHYAFQNRFANAFDVLASPHRFDEVMIVLFRLRVQRIHPTFNSS